MLCSRSLFIICFLCFMCVCVHSAIQLCLFAAPGDCSPPGSSVHGIEWARILEWVAMPSSRRSSQPRDRTWVSSIEDRFLTD